MGGGIRSIWIIENVINFVTRFSVPCFVMLSGAFVLQSKKYLDIKKFYIKSFFKICVPFLVIYILWMLIYAVKALFTGDIVSFFGTFLKGTYGNLWFVPMLIGLYLISPLIVKLKGEKVIPLSVGVGLLVWAVISQSTSEYELPYSIGVICSFLSYFVMGNILYESRIKIKVVFLITGIIIISLVATWWRCYNHQFYSMEYYRAFFSPFVVILSILIFILFKKISVRNSKMIEWLSAKTYYIYLLHTPILIFVQYKFERFSLNELNKIWIEMVIVTLLSIGASIIYEKTINIFIKKVRKCNKI